MRICLRDCKYSKYASKILMGLPEHLFHLGSIMSRSPSVVWISCNFLQKLTGPSFNATLDLFIVPEDQPESSRRPKNPFISNCANKRGRGLFVYDLVTTKQFYRVPVRVQISQRFETTFVNLHSNMTDNTAVTENREAATIMNMIHSDTVQEQTAVINRVKYIYVSIFTGDFEVFLRLGIRVCI